MNRLVGHAIAVLLLLAPLAPARGAAVKIFRVTGSDAFSQGEADGARLDALGRLRLGQRFEKHAAVEQPFLFSAVAHEAGGLVLGTGNSGELLRVSPEGEVTELATLPEPEIFAVTVLPDGAVAAGTSPDGKVYRVTDDGFEVLFEPGQRYIWDLEVDDRGRLLVATGGAGRLYRVDTGSGESEELLIAEDPHVRRILVVGDEVVVGTAGSGLVLRIDAEGRRRTLHDADQPEITALAQGEDGVIYAAAVASEASFVDLSSARASSRGEDDEEDESDDDEAAAAALAATVGSRPASFTGPRAVLLRLAGVGTRAPVVEELAELERQTVYALEHTGGELWLGTGQDGKLYRWTDRGLSLEQDLEDLQIVEILQTSGKAADGASLLLATTNAAAIYRAAAAGAAAGTFTSDVLDAKGVARFGSLHWEGRSGRAGDVEFSGRSGMSGRPDGTWSDWVPVGSSREASLGEVPEGRYFQWRAELSGDRERGPEIVAVDVSYRQVNRAPEVQKIEVLEPGEVLVASGFNPSNQAFEPAHPNRDGIFTTLGDPASDDKKRTKTLWKLGYRTLRWEATDPNGDTLRYRVEFLPVGEPDGEWLTIGENLEHEYYGFDSTVLPDGSYRFRVVASDAVDNGSEALEGERVTGAVLVDHTPPALAVRGREDGRLELEISDSLNPIRRIELSVDAEPWQVQVPADSLTDGRRERVTVDVPASSSLLLLRVQDAAFNIRTYDLRALPEPPRRGGGAGS